MISQEQKRKLGIILLSACAIYTFPLTRGILSILDKPLYGTIAGVHIVAGLAGYVIYLVWNRNL